jgi:Zn finger protein HypA/HybF involved in hydrogenase expression
MQGHKLILYKELIELACFNCHKVWVSENEDIKNKYQIFCPQCGTLGPIKK